MTSENSAAAASAKESRRFFEKQLLGEQPLSFETASLLYQMPTDFFQLEPRELLADKELILMRDIESGEICYCSVMGTLGEVLSLQVYVGAESYRFFRKIISHQPITPGDFYASVRGVSVEFAMAEEQTPVDREMLGALGHPKKRGIRGPVFRANRPEYHPWYVTESEGRLLAQCMRGMLAFCRREYDDMDAGSIDYWAQEDVYPLLVLDPSDKTHRKFEMQLVKAPEPALASPRPAEFDEDLVSDILRQNPSRRRALEADHFFSGAKTGKKNERKACMNMALVSDADSRFAFKPELGAPEEPTGDVLVRALLSAMRDRQFVPREVRIRQKEFQIVLSALSERLGFKVRVNKSLPAVDDLKEQLFAMMGDPGPMPDF